MVRQLTERGSAPRESLHRSDGALWRPEYHPTSSSSGRFPGSRIRWRHAGLHSELARPVGILQGPAETVIRTDRTSSTHDPTSRAGYRTRRFRVLPTVFPSRPGCVEGQFPGSRFDTLDGRHDLDTMCAAEIRGVPSPSLAALPQGRCIHREPVRSSRRRS